MKIKSRTQLLGHSNIYPLDPNRFDRMTSKERYLYRILREQYHEVAFWLNQYKSRSEKAGQRLSRALIAISMTYVNSDQKVARRFFESVGEDMDCLKLIRCCFTFVGTVDQQDITLDSVLKLVYMTLD